MAKRVLLHFRKHRPSPPLLVLRRRRSMRTFCRQMPIYRRMTTLKILVQVRIWGMRKRVRTSSKSWMTKRASIGKFPQSTQSTRLRAWTKRRAWQVLAALSRNICPSGSTRPSGPIAASAKSFGVVGQVIDQVRAEVDAHNFGPEQQESRPPLKGCA